MKLYIFETDNHNPYRNLAMERYLTLKAGKDSCLLYLWQNDNTVVIGKNQNCRAECDAAALEAGGGFLARRMSGGGAVYHDLGNLNFSFIAPSGIYDVSRQLNVITAAVNSFDLPYKAQRTGRNDIEINGAKFSGNAFINAENSCHHGTILISTDFDRLARYLSVPEKKLEAKGVKSVRSRVINLSSLGAAITVPAMKKALYAAFEKEYGETAEPLNPESFDGDELERLYGVFSAKSWVYNDFRLMRYRASERFAWGLAEIGFNLAEGKISEIQAFTDALDGDLAEIIENTFLGRELAQAAPEDRQELADVWEMIKKINN